MLVITALLVVVTKEQHERPAMCGDTVEDHLQRRVGGPAIDHVAGDDDEVGLLRTDHLIDVPQRGLRSRVVELVMDIGELQYLELAILMKPQLLGPAFTGRTRSAAIKERNGMIRLYSI